ncbi:hypothetical protein PHLGIDRAFT_142537 [Phlebiopsis gigantea 11061_1 CR5-6]|uniref:Secreted protein n=1 Tax=Phlebiopsis gigantea (strain 11061_1 CR5-6) TaxID=745531 RepID=A0A0C3SF21_PHLG1|nr:hypothetical protein PHLGIDRAFT_142537 [Phlebiopsis gigantea 11061_1 CR5-6]
MTGAKCGVGLHTVLCSAWCFLWRFGDLMQCAHVGFSLRHTTKGHRSRSTPPACTRTTSSCCVPGHILRSCCIAWKRAAHGSAAAPPRALSTTRSERASWRTSSGGPKICTLGLELAYILVIIDFFCGTPPYERLGRGVPIRGT